MIECGRSWRSTTGWRSRRDRLPATAWILLIASFGLGLGIVLAFYRNQRFFAKKARGLMSAYIIKNRLKDPEDIKGFDVAGYTFNKGMSSQDKWTFTREEDGA